MELNQFVLCDISKCMLILEQMIQKESPLSHLEMIEVMKLIYPKLKHGGFKIKIDSFIRQISCSICNQSNVELVEIDCPKFHGYCFADLKQKVYQDTKQTLQIFNYNIQCPCGVKIPDQRIVDAWGGYLNFKQGQREIQKCKICNSQDKVLSLNCKRCFLCDKCIQQKVSSDTYSTYNIYDFSVKCPCQILIQPDIILQAFGGQQFLIEWQQKSQKCQNCQQAQTQLYKMNCKKCFLCQLCLVQKAYQDTDQSLYLNECRNIKCKCQIIIDLGIIINAFGGQKEFKIKQNEAHKQLLQNFKEVDQDFFEQKFLCQLCYMEWPINKAYKCVSETCDMIWDKDCYSLYLTESINTGKIQPDQLCCCKCKIPVPSQAVKELCAPDVFDKFNYLQMRDFQGAKQCLTPDCPNILLIGEGILEFNCSICKKVYCLSCRANHQDMNCQEWKKKQEDDQQNQLQYLIQI